MFSFLQSILPFSKGDLTKVIPSGYVLTDIFEVVSGRRALRYDDFSVEFWAHITESHADNCEFCAATFSMDVMRYIPPIMLKDVIIVKQLLEVRRREWAKAIGVVHKVYMAVNEKLSTEIIEYCLGFYEDAPKGFLAHWNLKQGVTFRILPEQNELPTYGWAPTCVPGVRVALTANFSLPNRLHPLGIAFLSSDRHSDCLALVGYFHHYDPGFTYSFTTPLGWATGSAGYGNGGSRMRLNYERQTHIIQDYKFTHTQQGEPPLFTATLTVINKEGRTLTSLAVATTKAEASEKAAERFYEMQGEKPVVNTTTNKAPVLDLPANPAHIKEQADFLNRLPLPITTPLTPFELSIRNELYGSGLVRTSTVRCGKDYKHYTIAADQFAAVSASTGATFDDFKAAVHEASVLFPAVPTESTTAEAKLYVAIRGDFSEFCDLKHVPVTHVGAHKIIGLHCDFTAVSITSDYSFVPVTVYGSQIIYGSWTVPVVGNSWEHAVAVLESGFKGHADPICTGAIDPQGQLQAGYIQRKKAAAEKALRKLAGPHGCTLQYTRPGKPAVREILVTKVNKLVVEASARELLKTALMTQLSQRSFLFLGVSSQGSTFATTQFIPYVIVPGNYSSLYPGLLVPNVTYPGGGVVYGALPRVSGVSLLDLKGVYTVFPVRTVDRTDAHVYHAYLNVTFPFPTITLAEAALYAIENWQAQSGSPSTIFFGTAINSSEFSASQSPVEMRCEWAHNLSFETSGAGLLGWGVTQPWTNLSQLQAQSTNIYGLIWHLDGDLLTGYCDASGREQPMQIQRPPGQGQSYNARLRRRLRQQQSQLQQCDVQQRQPPQQQAQRPVIIRDQTPQQSVVREIVREVPMPQRPQRVGRNIRRRERQRIAQALGVPTAELSRLVVGEGRAALTEKPVVEPPLRSEQVSSMFAQSVADPFGTNACIPDGSKNTGCFSFTRNYSLTTGGAVGNVAAICVQFEPNNWVALDVSNNANTFTFPPAGNWAAAPKVAGITPLYVKWRPVSAGIKVHMTGATNNNQGQIILAQIAGSANLTPASFNGQTASYVQDVASKCEITSLKEDMVITWRSEDQED